MGDESFDIFKEQKASLFPTPRPFQDKAHEMLRDGYKHGHKNQLICAPTGAGKTVLSLRIINEALKKNKRAVFICDRKTLINQTSETADRYGMDHGIIQADHWRRKPESNFQIASIQTLMRRKWPGFDVAVVDECFVDGTEILTDKGFVDFKHVDTDCTVAQYNKDQSIEFVKPTGIVSRMHIGNVVRFYGTKGFDIVVTPNHDMVIEHGARGIEKVMAYDLKPNHYKRFIAAGYSSVKSTTSLTPIERMYIAFQADGSVHNIPSNGTMVASFTFVKDRKIDRFLDLIEDGGWRITETTAVGDRRRFLVYGLPVISKEVAEHFNIAEIGHEKAVAIINEMVEWDGSKISDTLLYYSSVVKRNADFYQSICAIGGIRSRITVQVDDRSDAFSDVYRLFVRTDESTVCGGSIDKETISYSGMVHCVTVPSGMIIVRRNGRVVVCGNCHVQMKSWVDFAMDKSIKTAVIGLTATPFSKGLGKIFTNAIMAATMHELTQQGILVPMRVFSCTKPDMAGAETLGGEWTDKAAEERELQIVGDVVTEWVKFGENRKTIIFGSTIAHCEEMCRQFNEAGICAAVYTSHTSDDERAEILDEYKQFDSPLKILISVEALARGFDVPAVSCLGDARPLRKSFSTVIQMWGRALRASPETSKTDAILLDFSGNVHRFAESFEHFYFNGIDKLDDGEKLDKEVRKDDPKEERKCPQCGHIPFVKRCASCGFERVSLSLIEHLPGEMREITIGKKKAAESPEHLWAQIATFSRSHGKPETASARAYYLYRDIMGTSPPRHFDMSVPAVEVSAAVIGKIRSRQIAHAKGMEKRRA